MCVAGACSNPAGPSDPAPEVFQLPAGAPADAAAAPGTTRITITKIEMRHPDNRIAVGTRIPRDPRHAFWAWVFCPRGLERELELTFFAFSGLRVTLVPGYNHLDLQTQSSSFAGTYSYKLTLWERFIPVAERTLDFVVE
jgi:hypothetical protein